jgi:hypothetical protein
MNWTNQNVDIELNGEKIYTFEDNGEYEFQYKYTDSNSNEQTETAKAEVTWIVTNLGDINNDGNIDVTDLILLKRHIVAGNRTEWILIGQGENSADINGDGNVDVTDLLLLKRHIVAGNKEEWKIKTHVTSST